MTLQPGMIFTIEPMINAGKPAVKLLPDQWTVVTKDHQLTAQWEHTILVTDTGYEILTHRSDDDLPQNRIARISRHSVRAVAGSKTPLPLLKAALADFRAHQHTAFDNGASASAELITARAAFIDHISGPLLATLQLG